MMESKIEGVEIVEYPVIHDDRGSLHEFLNTGSDRFKSLTDSEDAYPKNIYCSVTDPLVVKAFHYHEKQTDFFFAAPNSAKTRIVLYDSKADIVESYYVGEGCHQIGIRIPCGVHHGWQNMSRSKQSMIINASNRAYDYNEPDEIRAPAEGFVPAHHKFFWGVVNR